MNKTASPVKWFLPSLVVLAAGLAAVLTGAAPRFAASAAEMIDFPQFYLGIALAVVIAFAFGAIRYSLSVGWTLGLISLHDLLVTLAVTALVSLALPQAVILPVLILFVPVFTFANSLTVIRAARDLRAANSIRDMSNQEAAEKATSSTRGLRIGGAVLALVFLAAAAAGGVKLAGALLPLLIGLLVSLASSCFLTGKVWLLMGAKSLRSSGK